MGGARFGLYFVLVSLFILCACSSVPAQCRGLEGGALSRCVVDAATSAKDPSSCNLLTNATRTWCLTSVAVAKDDLATCDLVADRAEASYCKVEVITTAKAFNRCGDVAQPGADRCFDAAARATKVWQTCLNMTPGAARQQCVEDIGRVTDNPAACASLALSNPGRDSCLFLTSISTNATESCSDIQDNDLEDYCVINIAAKAHNTTICDAVGRKSMVSVCRSIVLANGTLPKNATLANLTPSQ